MYRLIKSYLFLLSLIIIQCIISPSDIMAQMKTDAGVLYGNEWIDYDKTYFKIKISEDGIYRIAKSTLLDYSIPINEINGNQFQLFALGKEIPIYTSTNTIFDESDFIEFYGYKNRGEIDQYLYNDSEAMQLNPKYSLFNDTLTYFLTWDNQNNNARLSPFENNLSQDLPPKEPYYLAEFEEVFSNNYYKITHDGSNHIQYSNFEIQEGFSTSAKLDHNFQIPLDHIYEAGPNANLRIRTGGNNVEHNTSFTLNGELIYTNPYNGYKISDLNITVPLSNLSHDNKLNIKKGTTADRTAISYFNLQYPRFFNANGEDVFNFKLAPHQDDFYIEIEDFNSNNGDFLMYDLTNAARLYATIDNDNIIKLRFPNQSESSHIVLINTNEAIQYITQLKEKKFIQYKDLDPSYLILTSKKLNQSNQEENAIQNYANYRKSAVGGAHDVDIIEVESLYDQFAYGIDRHAISIRNFANQMNSFWSNWEYTFIIGKAIVLNQYRTSTQISNLQDQFHVPTFGYVGSDNLLFSDPAVNYSHKSVGRLAATNHEQINDYLDKIKQQEDYKNLPQNITEKHWTKNILHLGGGEGISQQQQFKYKLNALKSTIENNSYGAHVKSFFKNSSESVQSAVTDDLINYIDNGVSIISFLGHSAVGTFDFNIEQVDAYNNKNKYPILLSMGCYSGNIHIQQEGMSHQFVLKKDKGVVAFIASDGTAYSSNLTQFANRFYQLLGGEMYGSSIGNIWQSIYKFYSSNTSIGNITLTQQNTIHGDPAIKLYPFNGSDFIIDYNSIDLDPKIISSAEDQFQFQFDIVNLGRASTDSIDMLIRLVSETNMLLYEETIRILAPKNRTSFDINIPLNDNQERIGSNTILVDLDLKNEIQETPSPHGELNNSLKDQNGNEGYKFHIIDNNIVPVFPIEFGITTDNIELISSISNIFLAPQNYIIQIDTTERFNPPMEETIIHQAGGLLTWTPPIIPKYNTVYYWRVSPDSTKADIGYIWNTSSFLYHESLNQGWNQSDYYQFDKNQFEDLNISTSGQFDYATNHIPFRILNRQRTSDQYPSYYIDNNLIDYNDGFDIKSGVYIIVSDTVNATPWINPEGGLYGSDTPDNWKDRKVFPFKTETIEDRMEIMDFLTNTVPDGYNIILMNIQSDDDPSNAHLWPEDFNIIGRSINQILLNQGASKINSLSEQPELPYVFAYRKNLFPLTEILAESKESPIDKIVYCAAKWYEGSVTSTIVGPVKSWNKILWEEQISENDSSIIELLIFDESRMLTETRIISNIANEYDLSDLDASNFPYLQLKYNTKDIEDRTSPQLRYWRIDFESIPEMALDPQQHFVFHADSLFIGEALNMELSVRNISTSPTDSVLVHYNYIDHNNVQKTTSERLAPLKEGASMILKHLKTIEDLNDDFTYNVEINPDKDQLELNHSNNLLIRKIILKKDNINPILNVTFDGLHIMNEDIISPTPLIKISLKDDNPFLLTEDINQFSIYMTSPNGNRSLLDLSSPEIIFYSSADESNDAYIEYTPHFIESGNYEIEIQAKDASGNISGDQSYKVQFQIILEQKISEVINYPNPFSNSTQFVFTLGGTIPAEDMSIKILTISGKVVKEISAQEIGPLRIGVNKTNYIWDGKDEYGAPLANGVYLYKVSTKKSNGENYELLNTSLDTYFNNGWGKLTILR